MKHLKQYEHLVENEGLNVGDFVQIYTTNKFYGYYDREKMRNMVNSTIGKISSIENREFIVAYRGKYENKYLRFTQKDIVAIGKTKEEVEAKLAANKYNI